MKTNGLFDETTKGEWAMSSKSIDTMTRRERVIEWILGAGVVSLALTVTVLFVTM